MEAAVICVLACRGFRYIRHASFGEKQLEDISEQTAKSIMEYCTDTNDVKASRMYFSRKETSIHRSSTEPGSKRLDFNFFKKYINLNIFACSGESGPCNCACAISRRD